MKYGNLILNLAFVLCSLSSIVACADYQKKSDTVASSQNQSVPTADQRKTMIDTHQKMADCLKSNQSVQQCQTQMMQNCPHCKNMMGMSHQGMMGNNMGCGMGCCGDWNNSTIQQ